MAKQMQSIKMENVKVEKTECVEMANSSKAKNNPNIEVLPALIIDRSTAADDNVKYIYKRIYINYEKKNWNDVVKDINIYQQITKSKKLEVLKM
ncbi:unnamed protein product [Rotaria sp. Silwood1]|nr:unnamed protein product [Rotaria sp. Silwood1]